MLSFNNITQKVLWNMEEARKIYNNIEMNCMHCAWRDSGERKKLTDKYTIANGRVICAVNEIE